MPVSIDEARHAARLARLALEGEELETLAKDLSVVLDHFERVAELASGDGATSSGGGSSVSGRDGVVRSDTVGPMLTTDEALRNAPATKDGQFTVPGFLPDEP